MITQTKPQEPDLISRLQRSHQKWIFINQYQKITVSNDCTGVDQNKPYAGPPKKVSKRNKTKSYTYDSLKPATSTVNLASQLFKTSNPW